MVTKAGDFLARRLARLQQRQTRRHLDLAAIHFDLS
jgi:hypothetical protein